MGQATYRSVGHPRRRRPMLNLPHPQAHLWGLLIAEPQEREAVLMRS